MPKLSRGQLNAITGGLLGLGTSWIWGGLLQQLAQAQTEALPVQQFNWFQAIALGAVQGLTEFLPISSTAHLKAVPVALGWGDPGVTFTAIVQLGSIAAVVWYFWSDLRQLILGSCRALQKRDFEAHDLRMSLGIAVGTIPIVIAGLALKAIYSAPGSLDNSWLRSMLTIAIVSMVMALLLAVSEFVGKHKRNYEQLVWQDAILMGFAQSLALIPGVSRSGSTLTAGLFANLERATAARFSFLMGIPAITLAGLVELKEVFDSGLTRAQVGPIVIGAVSSAIFSYLAIAWLIRFLQQRKTWAFVWYRLGFGLLILLGIATGQF